MRLLSLLSAAAGITAAAPTVNEAAFAQEDVISKDVAIIGGGASGTYAAVRLREDLDTSIIVIEKTDRLGGHVNTYLDPVSNASIDYGVEAYLRYGHSVAFFKRFNVPITPYIPAESTPVYVDIADGSLLKSYEPPSFNATVTAIEKWLDLTSSYTRELLPGLWNFWDPSDIPSELLLPFGEFAERHNLQAMYPTVAVISNVGVGGVRDILTLYVYFSFGKPVASEFLKGSLFVPKDLSNSELYIRALDLLREDVMLQSQVIAAERGTDGVKLVVKCANGGKKLVKAKRLLFTPPPSLQNLAPFDLDSKERAPLSTWTGTWSFAAVARIPSIPENHTVYYTAPTAAPHNWLDTRDWPFTLSFASTSLAGENLFEVLFATNYSISHAEAKQTIAAAVQNLTANGPFKSSNSEIDFLAFVDHNSVLWRQTPAELKAGIVQDLYSLQGYRSTWYTGGLWSEDYTGNVWAFTDTVLPKMLAGLHKGTF